MVVVYDVAITLLDLEDTRRRHQCCGLSGQQFQYFFVFTGGGGNGKDFLNDQFIYLLDENGYAAIVLPTKSGPNPELRSLHKKRFVRFAEPNPGQKTEAIRLKNVDELTGCESVVARDCHSNDTDTHLHKKIR